MSVVMDFPRSLLWLVVDLGSMAYILNSKHSQTTDPWLALRFKATHHCPARMALDESR